MSPKRVGPIPVTLAAALVVAAAALAAPASAESHDHGHSYSVSTGDGFGYVLFDPDQDDFSGWGGSSDDWARMRDLAASEHTRMLWVRDGDREYLIRDAGLTVEEFCALL